ncbi:hypothetical protein DFQ30_001631 [Apophysomyces sp. BC1015]|nr:hypothetical protein DFQ30_001631 [Apophysomyces sp. BC1015]
MELPLPYEDDTFDYVFIRSMVDTVPDEEWDAVLREFVRIMKKGAFIECVEAYENLFDAGPAMSTILRRAFANSSSPSPPNSPTTGVPSGTIQNPLPNRMAAIGHLMGMQIRHTHTPVGLYGGAVGSSLLEYWERIIQSSRQKWIQDKLIGEKELEEVVNELRGEVEEYKTYMSWYSVVAQKKGYKGPVIRFEDVDT